jgi:hypothetical protein
MENEKKENGQINDPIEKQQQTKKEPCWIDAECCKSGSGDKTDCNIDDMSPSEETENEETDEQVTEKAGKEDEIDSGFEEKLSSTGEKISGWLKGSYEKGKEEVFRFSKVSRIKLDIVSLKKKKDERTKLLGGRVLELVKQGIIDKELIEPEFSMITSIDAEILDKHKEIADITKKHSGEEEEMTIPTVESQKVLTAQSIPVEPDDAESEKADSETEDSGQK